MGQFYEDCAEALIRHVRYAAWLNTAPVEDKKQSISKGDVRPFTRLEQYRKEHGEDYEPDMPDLPGHDQLLRYLWDCGPSLFGPMGAQPLTHTEIRCWQDNTGTELNAWEARTLRRLSAEHVGQSQAAQAPGCPSPIAPPELSQEERAAVAQRVQGAFRMLIATRPARGA